MLSVSWPCVYVQVERSLQQSRVAQLETEVRRLAAAEVTLREERASHTRDRENLMLVQTTGFIGASFPLI